MPIFTNGDDACASLKNTLLNTLNEGDSYGSKPLLPFSAVAAVCSSLIPNLFASWVPRLEINDIIAITAENAAPYR